MTALPGIECLLARAQVGPSEKHATDVGAQRRRGFSLQIDWDEAVEQAMLHGEQRGRRAVRCPDLGVDALDMRLRCLRRDAEATGDLPGGRAAGDQGEYLDLTRGEPGWPGPPLPPLLADGSKHGIHRIALQVTRPDLSPQFVSSLLARQGWPVRPGLAHGVAGVGGGEDPSSGGYRGSGQAAVVAGPIEALVGKRCYGTDPG